MSLITPQTYWANEYFDERFGQLYKSKDTAMGAGSNAVKTLLELKVVNRHEVQG